MFAFVIWDCKKEALRKRSIWNKAFIGYNIDGVILSSQVKTLLSTKYISTDKDTISQFSFNLGYNRA